MPAKLEFTAGNPRLTSVTGKRTNPADNLAPGKITASFNTSLSLGDDNRTVNVEVTVETVGVSPTISEPAFEICCSFACAFVFTTDLTKEDVENERMAALLSRSLYHRTIVLTEEVAHNMGYSGVRLPLISPADESVLRAAESDDQGSEPPRKKRTTRRKIAAQ